MVTKREQLEWLAKECDKWPSIKDYMWMSNMVVGFNSFIPHGSHRITREEWQRERDKMQRQQDNSWHERGEFPPVGLPVELWVCGRFAYNCEFISKRSNNYVLWNLDSDKADSADCMHSEFRPLRTEREKAIDEMAKLIGVECQPSPINISSNRAAEILYDAGYRKQ